MNSLSFGAKSTAAERFANILRKRNMITDENPKPIVEEFAKMKKKNGDQRFKEGLELLNDIPEEQYPYIRGLADMKDSWGSYVFDYIEDIVNINTIHNKHPRLLSNVMSVADLNTSCGTIGRIKNIFEWYEKNPGQDKTFKTLAENYCPLKYYCSILREYPSRQEMFDNMIHSRRYNWGDIYISTNFAKEEYEKLKNIFDMKDINGKYRFEVLHKEDDLERLKQICNGEDKEKLMEFLNEKTEDGKGYVYRFSDLSGEYFETLFDAFKKKHDVYKHVMSAKSPLKKNSAEKSTLSQRGEKSKDKNNFAYEAQYSVINAIQFYDRNWKWADRIDNLLAQTVKKWGDEEVQRFTFDNIEKVILPAYDKYNQKNVDAVLSLKGEYGRNMFELQNFWFGDDIPQWKMNEFFNKVMKVYNEDPQNVDDALKLYGEIVSPNKVNTLLSYIKAYQNDKETVKHIVSFKDKIGNLIYDVYKLGDYGDYNTYVEAYKTSPESFDRISEFLANGKTLRNIGYLPNLVSEHSKNREFVEEIMNLKRKLWNETCYYWDDYGFEYANQISKISEAHRDDSNYVKKIIYWTYPDSEKYRFQNYKIIDLINVKKEYRDTVIQALEEKDADGNYKNELEDILEAIKEAERS